MLTLTGLAILAYFTNQGFCHAVGKPMLYELTTPNLHKLGSSASTVKWGECDSLHIYDMAQGKSEPDPPVVGSSIGLDLDIIFNAAAKVSGIFVSVEFTAEGSTSPITLYS